MRPRELSFPHHDSNYSYGTLFPRHWKSLSTIVDRSKNMKIHMKFWWKMWTTANVLARSEEWNLQVGLWFIFICAFANAQIKNPQEHVANADNPEKCYDCYKIWRKNTFVLLSIMKFVVLVSGSRLIQNRRQKVFNRAALRFCGGLDTKNWQNLNWFIVFHVSI